MKKMKKNPVKKVVKKSYSGTQEKVFFDKPSEIICEPSEIIQDNREIQILRKPEILAPAGDMPSFLGALAAGADAVYVGLKHFSARMQADNFSTSELAKMTELARSEDRKVYIAFNSLVKSNDVNAAARLVKRLERDVKPHALIVQDLGMLELARQVGFSGEMHLSTLSNITHAQGLEVAKRLNASRVILPREISLDEIKDVASKCPEGIDLELFVHGALCFCVSGRCYWSSYMGGKSGLRGRCVQPCRRVYTQGKRKGRYFSSLDLSLDVLARTLLDIPQLSSWKIEGRKKGSHYVYHAVTAYKMLRDHGDEAKVRKDVDELLEMALGRPRTHAGFLPQKDKKITSVNEQTSSGMLIGHVTYPVPEKKQKTQSLPQLKTRIELVPKDYLRVGYEDESWHTTLPVSVRVPKAATFPLRVSFKRLPKPGTPVFLIDRREAGLQKLLQEWAHKLERCKGRVSKGIDGEHNVDVDLSFPPVVYGKKNNLNINLRSRLPQGKETRLARSSVMGMWLSQGTLRGMSNTVIPRTSWWLPPVIWQNEENMYKSLIREALRKNAYMFVLNAPWQVDLFKDANVKLTAGPFCNIANRAALTIYKNLGFEAAIVSPELTKEDFLSLPSQSPLPLGIVISACWAMGIARHGLSGLKANEAFQSPMREQFWARHYGQNLWIYPNWMYDITDKVQELEKAGYSFLVKMQEAMPHDLPEAKRVSSFNWDNDLL